MHSQTISLQPSLAVKAQRALQPLFRAVSDTRRRWMRARQVNATARALDVLDDRQLRDLGMDRSELLSAAAELHGQAPRERLHVPAGMPLRR